MDVVVASTIITGPAPANNCPASAPTLHAGLTAVAVSDRADGPVVMASAQEGPLVAGSGGDALVAWLVDTTDGRRLFAAKLHPETQGGMNLSTTSPFPERLDGAFDGPASYALVGVAGGALVATAEPAGAMYDVKVRRADLALLSFGPPVTIATIADPPELTFIRNADVPSLYVLSGGAQSVARLTPAGVPDGPPVDLGNRTTGGAVSDPVAFEDGYLFAANASEGVSLVYYAGPEPPMTVDVPAVAGVSWGPAIAAIEPGHILIAGRPLGDDGSLFMDFNLSISCP